MPVLVNASPSVFSLCPGLLDTLLLTLPPLFIVPTGHGGQHVQEHVIDGAKHTVVKICQRRREMQPGCGHINGHNPDVLSTNHFLQGIPVIAGQAGKAIDILNQQYVTSPGVPEQAKQLRTVKPGTGFIFSVIVTYCYFMLTGKPVEHVAGTLGILFTGGGPKVGPNKHGHGTV